MSTMASSSKRLLQLAVPLVKQHGFTREALSLSVLSLPTPHEVPLSDAAISSLFGQGDDARRSLIVAWQDEAREEMKTGSGGTMREVLKKRLECNEPVLSYLPEVRLSSNTLMDFWTHAGIRLLHYLLHPHQVYHHWIPDQV